MRRTWSTLTFLGCALGWALPARAAPVGEWRLDEGSWATGVVDGSGRGHPGVALGGAAPAGGHGSFASTPGCSDCARVEISGDLGIGGAPALTVSAWVRWTVDPATAPRAVIVSQASTLVAPAGAVTANAGLFWLRTGGDSNPGYQFGVRVGSYNVFVTGMSRPRQGVWTHLTGVYDGARVMLYVDGALEASTAITGPIAPMRPEYRTVLGAAAIDEGPGIGRRPFIGELDEVRVETDALAAEGLRTAACAAGPADALATFCGDSGPMCPVCLEAPLTATRWYTPAQILDGNRELCRPTTLAVPAQLAVTSGRATGGSARLSFGDVVCTYEGREASAYTLGSCSNGARAGDRVLAGRLALHLDGGDTTAGTTRVAVTVAELGEPPALELVAPEDGAVLERSVVLQARARGAAGPLVMLVDDQPFTAGELGSEGEHVFTVRAPGCHVGDALATRTFTIDRSAPTIAVAGVRDGEVRDGAVELAFSATDLSGAVWHAILDDRPVLGRVRVTTPGPHRLIVTASDALGHTTTLERRFTIVDLVSGRDDPPPPRLGDTRTCSDRTGEQTLAVACNDPCSATTRANVFDLGVCEAICRSEEQQAAITAARCEDRAWLDSPCGRIEQARWDAVVNDWLTPAEVPSGATSVCAQLKTELGHDSNGDAAVDSLGGPVGALEERLLPATLTRGDGAILDVEPREIDDHTRHFHRGPVQMFHSGGTGTFGAMRRKEAIRASSLGAHVTGLSPLDEARRDQWEANGNQVASCEEYVYERFYNMNKYEDEVARHGGDFRAYVDVAYAPMMVLPLASNSGSDLLGQGLVRWPAGMLVQPAGSTAQLPPSYAIGTMGELGWPMRSRSGTPTGGYGDLADLSPHYKNVFFSMPTRNVKLGETKDLSGVVDSFWSGSPTCSGQYGGLAWMGLCDQDLAARVMQGYHVQVNRDWAYHHHESQVLHHWTDEDLYAADGLKAHYQQLLDRRAKIAGEIAATLHSAERRGYLTLPSPELPWDLYTSPTDALLVAQQSITDFGASSVLATPPPAQLQSFVGGTNPFAALYGPAQAPLAMHTTTSPLAAIAPITAQRYGSANQAGFTPVGGALVAEPADPAALLTHMSGLLDQLAFTDAALEDVLHQADRLGCLALDDDNPCDWSPRDFAQLVADASSVREEALYQECVRNTAQVDFAALAAGRALSIKDPAITSTTAARVHYGGGYDGDDKVLAIGKKYKPAGQPAALGKVFPLVRNGGVPTTTCGDYTCHTTVAWDGTTCALDPDGHPYVSLHDQPHSGLPGNPECDDCNVWTKNTDTVDLYFQCLALYKDMVFHAVEAKVGPILDENGQAKLGASAAETEAMGDDDWALDYGYAFGWTFGNFEAYRLNPTPAAQCLLQPEMYGSMHFGARAMGKHLDVVRGSAHARANPSLTVPGFDRPADVAADMIDAHVDLVVLDIDVARPTESGGTFSVVKDREERDAGNVPDPPIKVPFALGPIPMSLEAGLTGYVGVRYGAHAKVHTTPPCDHQSLSAHFTPFAGIEGFASVGLDILVAAAGVKISLTIVEVDLPFTESVGLVVDPEDGLSAHFDTNLDLELKTLGGRFSLFLRILFASWEWDLFTWDGISHKVQLMHNEMQVPLAPLTEAVNAAAVGAMP